MSQVKFKMTSTTLFSGKGKGNHNAPLRRPWSVGRTIDWLIVWAETNEVPRFTDECRDLGSKVMRWKSTFYEYPLRWSK